MRALVTGATGFVGKHLVLELADAGWEVTCLVRNPVTSAHPRVRVVHLVLGAAGKPGQLPGIAGRFDAVFHLGAAMPSQLPVETSTRDFSVNVAATEHVLRLAEETHARSVVYASGLPVIGKPTVIPVTEDHPVTYPEDPYLLSKLCGEALCEGARRWRGLNVTSLRITSPYGRGMRATTVLPMFASRALASENIQLYGSGNRTQNFVHVSDVVRAMLLAVTCDHPGIFNAAGPESVSMKDLAELVIGLVPESRSKVTFSGRADAQEDCRWHVDLSRAESVLKYVPRVDLSTGLPDLIRWLRTDEPTIKWWN